MGIPIDLLNDGPSLKASFLCFYLELYHSDLFSPGKKDSERLDASWYCTFVGLSVPNNLLFPLGIGPILGIR